MNYMQSELKKFTEYQPEVEKPKFLSQTNLSINSHELRTQQKYLLTSIFVSDLKKQYNVFATNSIKLDDAKLLRKQKTDFQKLDSQLTLYPQ